MKESDKQTPRENRTLSRAALGLLCLLVLVYFGLQLRDYLVDPFSTAAAAYTKVEETVSANGWLIRAEQVLPGEGSGLLRLTRQEGERVSQGGTVAKVYADQASLDRQTELDRLDERIEQLRYAAEESLSGVASLRLDSQIQDSLLSLRRSVEGGALAQAESEISQLRSLVLKRDYSRGDGTDAAAELAELQAQRKSLAAQGANSVRTLTAPKSGIYSAVVDGYETVLTPESLDTLTPSALSALTADSAVSSNVGKLITSDRWYYAAALPDDDAADLTEGQSVTLRFSKGAADDLPAEVWRIGASENGRTLVILSGREYLSELTLLRHQSASIILKTTEGIRVPQTALRVDTVTTTDENGEEITTRTTGVYTVVGPGGPLQARHRGLHRRRLLPGEGRRREGEPPPPPGGGDHPHRQGTVRRRRGPLTPAKEKGALPCPSLKTSPPSAPGSPPPRRAPAADPRTSCWWAPAR